MVGISAIAVYSDGSQNNRAPIDGEVTATTTESSTAIQTPIQQTKLTADDGDMGDWLGMSADTSGDGTIAVIGASREGDSDSESTVNFGGVGSAYVFEDAGGSWSQQTKLTPDDGDEGDSFAESVALTNDGDTAVIGAEDHEDPNGDRAGSAYVFTLVETYRSCELVSSSN